MSKLSSSIYGAGVNAPPHDLLKLLNWKEHCKLEHLPDNLRQKCPELARAISGHRRWEEDYVASALSRLRMEYTYWGRRDLDKNPFLLEVYGNPTFWPIEKRNDLWKKIQSFYENGESPHAHAGVNELLSDFPQDSRYPLVNLETHHWLTWVLRKQLNGKSTDSIRIMKISIPETVFHKLKSMREFHDRRKGFIKAVAMRIATIDRQYRQNKKRYSPRVIGDELYIVTTSREDVQCILEEMEKTGLACDVEIFHYNIGRVNVQVGKSLRSYRRVVGVTSPTELSIGSSVEWDYAPRHAEWTEALDFAYVAWISLKANHDLQKSSEEFLKYAEQILAQTPRRKIQNPLLSEVPVCPELLVSVAKGYDKFLHEFQGILAERKSSETSILRSFDRSLFVYGLWKPSKAISLYRQLSEKKKSLHIPATLSVVVTRPKHPFWHVLSLFGEEDNLVFASGGKLTVLSDEEIKVIQEVADSLRGTGRGLFHNELLMKSKRMGKEEFKFHMMGLAAENKLHRDARDKLCRLVDELAGRHKDEAERKIVTYRAFEALEPFTRR